MVNIHHTFIYVLSDTVLDNCVSYGDIAVWNVGAYVWFRRRFRTGSISRMTLDVFDYHSWKQKTKKKRYLMCKSSGQKHNDILTFIYWPDIHLRGGPFDIQGGGGGLVFYWESDNCFVFIWKPDKKILIIFKPDNFFVLDIRARYFFVCMYYNMTWTQHDISKHNEIIMFFS